MAILKQKAVNSVKWTAIQTIFMGLIGPIFLIIKARFLSPEEFAYISVILIIIGLFRLLESFGISQAIIQRDSVTVQESSSIFFFNIFLSFLFAGILYIISPIIANFYSLPRLEFFLRLVSITVLLTGPSLLFRAFLEKYLHFKYLSLIEITRNLIVVVATTLFLILDIGVLGIIFGDMLGTLFTTVSIAYLSFRLKVTTLNFCFLPKTLKPFIKFGIFVSGKQAMTFASQRIDEIVIGYFLAPEILGIYFFGKNLLDNLRNLMTNSFGKVLFPVLSQIKHDREKLSLAYQRISRYIAIGAFPVFGGIAATAHLFVPVVFGEQWIDSIVVFQVFSVAVIFLVLTANVSTSLLYSINKPHVVFYIDIATSALYFISLLFFASYGMIAILIAYSCYVVYKTIILQYLANFHLVHSFLDYFRELAVPTLSALIMVLVVLLFQIVSSPEIGSTSQLLGSIFIGAVVYGIISWLLDKTTLKELNSALIRGEST